MSKFHINSKGIPAPCSAKKGNCPFGDTDSHYASKEEAQKHIDKTNEKKHELLPNVRKGPKVNLKGTDLFVDGEYITDLDLCDYGEREEIIETYGINSFVEEIMDI